MEPPGGSAKAQGWRGGPWGLIEGQNASQSEPRTRLQEVLHDVGILPEPHGVHHHLEAEGVAVLVEWVFVETLQGDVA